MQDKNRKGNRKEKPGIALINSEEYIILASRPLRP